MNTYNSHSDPEALYLWNTQVTKALLEDIQHTEVLLRNRVDTVLSSNYGPRWYIVPAIPFSSKARKSIGKAIRRAGTAGGAAPPPGRVIAELSFDFWSFLFTRTYATTVWPKFQHTLVADPSNDADTVAVPTLHEFKSKVDIVYQLRNRCAHHEPIICSDIEEECSRLDRAQEAIALLTRWIEPDASKWIVAHSRVAELRSKRP